MNNKFFITSNEESNSVVNVINALNALSQVINHPTIKLNQNNQFAILHFESEQSSENIKNILNSNPYTKDSDNWIVEII